PGIDRLKDPGRVVSKEYNPRQILPTHQAVRLQPIFQTWNIWVGESGMEYPADAKFEMPLLPWQPGNWKYLHTMHGRFAPLRREPSLFPPTEYPGQVDENKKCPHRKAPCASDSGR